MYKRCVMNECELNLFTYYSFNKILLKPTMSNHYGMYQCNLHIDLLAEHVAYI